MEIAAFSLGNLQRRWHLHPETQGELNAATAVRKAARERSGGVLPAHALHLHEPALMLQPRLDRRCLPSQLGRLHSFTPAWEVAAAPGLALGKDKGGDRVNKCLLILFSAPACPRKQFWFPGGPCLSASPPPFHSINLNSGLLPISRRL